MATESTSCSVEVWQTVCCCTMASASRRDVRRKVATGGGTEWAISAMSSSGMTPGPLGMCDTRPSADAPIWTASRASSTLEMQQILTRGILNMNLLYGLTPALAANAAWYETSPEGSEPLNEIDWKYSSGTPGSTSDGCAVKLKRE